MSGEHTTVLVIDGETSTYSRGSPFDSRNNLMCIGYRLGADAGVLWFEYEPGAPVGNSVHALRTLIERAGVVVAFNAKFELHWLRRFGIVVDKPIWDTQLYEFIVSGQNPAMPSLEGVCKKYSLGEKYTEIEELWAMNLDARLIARETYVNRVTSDVELTLRLYAFQQEDQRKRSSQFINLIQLEMLDLRALEEMEYNGQLYNKNKAIDLATECRTESKTLSTNLDALVPNAPINWNSTLHKSAVLYGGLIEWSEREEIGQYKTGTKTGTPRYRIIDKSQTLERLCTPPEGSNLDREGYYSTAEPILRAISTGGRGKQIISLLLRRQELEKLIGTYYSGIPELIEEMGWTDNIVHGQFNQTVAVTGRLSSSKPNLQNQPELSKRLFITRFDDNSSR